MFRSHSRRQGAAHCSTLSFGLGSSGPVLGISGSELEAGVEYTFRLTISKDGMAPESTTQTVSTHNPTHVNMFEIKFISYFWFFPLTFSQSFWIYSNCTPAPRYIVGLAFLLTNRTPLCPWMSSSTPLFQLPTDCVRALTNI